MMRAVAAVGALVAAGGLVGVLCVWVLLPFPGGGRALVMCAAAAASGWVLAGIGAVLADHQERRRW